MNSPLETAVWWVEQVIATSGFELGRTNTPYMSWFSYHSIDAFFVVMTIILLLIFGIIKIFFFVAKTISIKVKKIIERFPQRKSSSNQHHPVSLSLFMYVGKLNPTTIFQHSFRAQNKSISIKIAFPLQRYLG